MDIAALRIWVDSVKKVEVSNSTKKVLGAGGCAFSDGDGGPRITRLGLSGANSKSICGGNWRQSKTTLAIWRICSDIRLAIFFNRMGGYQTIAFPAREPDYLSVYYDRFASGGCQASLIGGKIEGGSVLCPYTRQRELRKPTVVMTPIGEGQDQPDFLFVSASKEEKQNLLFTDHSADLCQCKKWHQRDRCDYPY